LDELFSHKGKKTSSFKSMLKLKEKEDKKYYMGNNNYYMDNLKKEEKVFLTFNDNLTSKKQESIDESFSSNENSFLCAKTNENRINRNLDSNDINRKLISLNNPKKSLINSENDDIFEKEFSSRKKIVGITINEKNKSTDSINFKNKEIKKDQSSEDDEIEHFFKKSSLSNKNINNCKERTNEVIKQKSSNNPQNMKDSIEIIKKSKKNSSPLYDSSENKTSSDSEGNYLNFYYQNKLEDEDDEDIDNNFQSYKKNCDKQNYNKININSCLNNQFNKNLKKKSDLLDIATILNSDKENSNDYEYFFKNKKNSSNVFNKSNHKNNKNNIKDVKDVKENKLVKKDINEKDINDLFLNIKKNCQQNIIKKSQYNKNNNKFLLKEIKERKDDKEEQDDISQLFVNNKRKKK